MTRLLPAKEYTSKDLWMGVKTTVSQIGQDDGCLIFDDTIQEKAVLEAVHKLNNRSRKCLGFKTPYEVFPELSGIDTEKLVGYALIT